MSAAVGAQSAIVLFNARVRGAGFARPANTTAYASGQLVANDVAPGNVVPVPIKAVDNAGDTGLIKALRLEKSGVSVANASFRVHLFRKPPVVNAGDGGVYLVNNGRLVAAEIGYFDVVMDMVYGDGAKGVVSIPERVFITDPTLQGNLYALVEARAAYAPQSGETFNVAFEFI